MAHAATRSPQFYGPTLTYLIDRNFYEENQPHAPYPPIPHGRRGAAHAEVQMTEWIPIKKSI